MDRTSTIELRTGRRMPVMGLGTWQMEGAIDAVLSALELGYALIDTSGDYGTQPGIGEAIRRSGVSRDAVYLVTKVEETDDAYEASKKNIGELGVPYADLILIHRPPSAGPGEELWRGLMRARDDGLAKDIGVSNYSKDLIDALIAGTGEAPVVNQIEWSPFGHSEEMLAYAGERGILIQAYSPLTRGTRLGDETLGSIAAEYAKTPAQILIRWNVQRGTVPIPKAQEKKHQEENIDVFDFEIGKEDMDRLNGLNERYSALGSLPYT